MVNKESLGAFLPNYEKCKTLDGLISEHLHQRRYHREKLEKYSDRLRKHLLELKCQYFIKDVILSGSLAKGTAIQKTADIDMVVFFKHLFNCDENEEEMIKCKRDVLDKLKLYFTGRCTEPKWIKKINLISNKNSYYLLTFQIFIKDSTENVEFDFKVDVLPAVDILNNYGFDQEAVYRKMLTMDANVRDHYSVSFAAIQKELIKYLPSKVKDVVRLLKYWKHKNCLPLKSYACEVLVLYIYESRSWSNFVTEVFFYVAMLILSRYDELQITLNKKYTAANWSHVFPTKPYIIDPANPFMNVISRKPDDIKIIKSVSHRTLLTFDEPDTKLKEVERQFLTRIVLPSNFGKGNYTGRPSPQNYTGRPSPQNYTGRPSPQNYTGRPSPQNYTGRPYPKNYTGRPSPQNYTRLSPQNYTGRPSPQNFSFKSVIEQRRVVDMNIATVPMPERRVADMNIVTVPVPEVRSTSSRRYLLVVFSVVAVVVTLTLAFLQWQKRL